MKVDKVQLTQGDNGLYQSITISGVTVCILQSNISTTPITVRVTAQTAVNAFPMIGQLTIPSWVKQMLDGAIFVPEDHQEFDKLSQLTSVLMYSISDPSALFEQIEQMLLAVMQQYDTQNTYSISVTQNK